MCFIESWLVSWSSASSSPQMMKVSAPPHSFCILKATNSHLVFWFWRKLQTNNFSLLFSFSMFLQHNILVKWPNTSYSYPMGTFYEAVNVFSRSCRVLAERVGSDLFSFNSGLSEWVFVCCLLLLGDFLVVRCIQGPWDNESELLSPADKKPHSTSVVGRKLSWASEPEHDARDSRSLSSTLC